MSKDTKNKIEEMINSGDVVVFMKGNPDFPQCGFSANVIGLLDHLNVKYTSYDVLQDDLLRQGIKDYSDWPTIPQVYIKNEFIGGCDILNELVTSGEIEEILNKNNINYDS
tara:strand:- start:676 stop:1008 length:333 start_codon:yes stop_codon:yes gene_type:complete